jgi:hypothetical protein
VEDTRTEDRQAELQKLLMGNAPLPPAPPCGGDEEELPQAPAVELQSEEIEALLKEGTPFALKRLFEIGMDPDSPKGAATKALEAFLDRAMGKVSQKVEMDFTGEEYFAMIRQAQKTYTGETIDG